MTSPRRARLLVLVGLVLLAVNLRPAATSVGPVLAEVTDGLSMAPVAAGLLTSLPVVAFATFGVTAPTFARAVGPHRAVLLSLAAVVTGLTGRSLVGSTGSFLALSMLGLAGMATANVLLPSLVKLHFPHRIGTVTALYTTALAIGLTAALTLTAPVAATGGGWRTGLGAWALLGLVAAMPWLWLAGHDRRPGPGPHRVALSAVARTPLGWGLAVLFGLQSIHAYVVFGWFAQLWRDAGSSPVGAGLLVGLVAAVSIPTSLLLPAVAGRRSDHRTLLWGVIACYPVAYLGLMVAPYSLGWLWALVTGAGTATFPLALTLIGLRARTAAGTAALSAFTQPVGYLIAAGGPFTVGLLYAGTGGWVAPLWFLLALVPPMAMVSAYVGRPRYVEDQLPAR